MKNFIKAVVCAVLCVSTVSVITGCNTSQNKTTETTSEQTTAPQESTFPATVDTASKKTGFNYARIKEKSEDITDIFNTYLNKHKFNGVVYYKIGNDFEFISEKGMAVIDEHKSNSLNTQYFVGSITKQITAAAVMKLAEDGKLTLNDTLDKYFPSYEYGEKITIRNLLTMTSGIKNYMPDDENSDADKESNSNAKVELSADNSKEENKKIIMDWILAQELLFEPDSKFRYSDSNYYLLGSVIEQASGMPYEDYVTENFFTPAGMNSSTFDKADNLANAYGGLNRDKWELYEGVGYSSTGMISTVSDLLRWVYAIDEYEILSEDSVKEMFTPYREHFAYGTYVNNKRSIITSKLSSFSSVLSYSQDKTEVYISLSNNKYTKSIQTYSALRKAINPYRK